MRFTYKGVTAEGQPVSGETEAESSEAAADLLSRAKIQATVLKPVRLISPLPLALGVTSADIATFCEQLANLTDSKLPLPEALGALARDAHKPALRAALKRVAEGLDAGYDLAELMARESRVLPPLLPALVIAGEASGNLPETLRLAATHTWRMGLLRERVVAALTYPLVVLALLCIIGGAAFLTVIPHFGDMFDGLGVRLPTLTIAILAVARHFYVVAAVVLGALLGIVLFFRLFSSLGPVLRLKRWILFHIPLLGRILRASYLARFCRFMSLLLASGMSLDKTIELLARLDRGTMPPREGEAFVSAIRGGVSLSDAMRVRHNMFPDLLTWIVGSCEKTGRLPEAFGETADMYERDAERNIQVMDSLLPGLLIIVVGSLIGLTVSAMFLPLVKLVETLS